MKILFIIQGEGRGHLTQALSLRQKLMAEGDRWCVGRKKPGPPFAGFLLE